jgi:hypothetical protein
MKITRIAAAAGILAGCGGSAPPTPASGTVIAHRLGCVGGYQVVGTDPSLVNEGQCGTWTAGSS